MSCKPSSVVCCLMKATTWLKRRLKKMKSRWCVCELSLVSIYPSIHPSIHPGIRPSLYLSFSLSISLAYTHFHNLSLSLAHKRNPPYAFPVRQVVLTALGISLQNLVAVVASDCLCRAKQSNEADETQKQELSWKKLNYLVDKATWYFFLAKETSIIFRLDVVKPMQDEHTHLKRKHIS